MVEGVAGEPRDHPHHESIWFTHGIVNGADFWAAHPNAHDEKHRVDNRIEHVELVACEGGPVGRLETRNRWVQADGKVACTDSRRLTFAADAAGRTIDYAVTIHADHGPVKFGDTKEGTFGLRVPATLQTKDAHGSKGAAGHILNSEGQTDAAAWGQAARWGGYWGPVDGNPFGLHDFTGAPAGSGDYTLPAGESRTFRYLVVLHEGETVAADIDGRWRRWAEATGAAKP
jgi:hypothetical protein